MVSTSKASSMRASLLAGPPDVCTNHKGYNAAGTGVDVCFDSMEVLCGTSALQK